MSYSITYGNIFNPELSFPVLENTPAVRCHHRQKKHRPCF